LPTNAPHQELLERLAASWPTGWQDWQSNTEHPLRYEIAALEEGHESHLPYFRGNEVAWLTVASDAASLRRAITGLKAWVIPSFAWEDRTRPIVHPNDYRGPMATALGLVAPAGYYRWHSTARAARSKVVDKLKSWRKLATLRPPASESTEPSLFELREQFRLALWTSDRPLAEAAVAAIDRRQLDTAVNTSFMSMRMRARFGLYEEIVREPDLARLVSLRIPEVVRVGITEAFYQVYIRDLVESGKSDEALEALEARVLPEISSLLSVARSDDSEGTRWLIEHLSPTPTSKAGPESDEKGFLSAMECADWIRAQEIGKRLIASRLSVGFEETLRGRLTESLKYQHDPELEKVLRSSEEDTPVRTWQEFLLAMREGSIGRAELFLESTDREPLDLSKPSATHDVISSMADLLTQPASAMDGSVALVLQRSVSSLIEDLVGDRSYPRYELAESYFLLLQTWVASRRSSALPADSNVMLSLALGVFQCPLHRETETAALLRDWWEGRPVKARLPFLLSAIELLCEFSSESSIGQGMWIDGITSISTRSVELTATERALWKSIGRGLGFDRATIEEYLPELPSAHQGEIEEDTLTKKGFRKIAIVSLHGKAARAAGAMIAERTGAEVVIVEETVAGSATESARSADVILLVWAATKHAVYRAFDDVRHKLAYVQGTGMTSIVLALEQWASQSHRS